MATIVTSVADFRIGTGAKLNVGTAGEAVDAFELIYLNGSDGKLYLADNTTAAKATLIGIAATSSATASTTSATTRSAPAAPSASQISVRLDSAPSAHETVTAWQASTVISSAIASTI